MAEAVQSVKDQITSDRDADKSLKDSDTNPKHAAESQPPASTVTTEPEGDDESSSELEESGDEGNPEGYRPRGKPSKPLASQAKPVKR